LADRARSRTREIVNEAGKKDSSGKVEVSGIRKKLEKGIKSTETDEEEKSKDEGDEESFSAGVPGSKLPSDSPEIDTGEEEDPEESQEVEEGTELPEDIKPVEDIVGRLREGIKKKSTRKTMQSEINLPPSLNSSFQVAETSGANNTTFVVPTNIQANQKKGGRDKEEKGSEEGNIKSYLFEDVSPKQASDIPSTDWELTGPSPDDSDDEDEKLTEVNEYYSLIPENPEPGENIYAYAHIYWSDEKDSLLYKVIEPDLSEKDEEILRNVKDIIQDRLDIDFDDLGRIKAKGYISERLEEALEIMGEDLTGVRKETVRYYLERDLIGMGKIEPIMRDPNIEEVSCDGYKIPIYVYHRNAKYGSMETNIVFEDEERLDNYVRRLGQMVGKTISTSDPLVDASLPDGSRLQATLATDIARKGSNFTIRKFTENPLTPVDLIEFGTVDPRVLAYMWLAIENQNSVLISGGTATGKTTMLNVISLFIKPEMKIVTIEDTAELRLPHNHWVPEVAREAMAREDSDTVDMFTLLKESLRQRPDYIVVGEVRGAEAFVLFQQISTGHPGLATIHAENPERLVSRLTTKPIDLPPSLIGSLDIVIFLRKVRKGDSLLRKIDQVVEVKRFSREENVPKMNQVFKWDPSSDKLVNENPSLVMKEIAKLKNMDDSELKSELRDRERVIQWMVHEGMRDLDEIGKILAKYYSDKESLMKKIEDLR